MNLNNLRSHFEFNKQQRSGILFLAGIIIALLCIYYFVDFSEKNILDTSSEEIVVLRSQIDSLRAVEIENRKPKVYPFNPNFITDYKAYTLGMSTEEYDRLKHFRDKEQWINSVADFKRVTKVSDSLLQAISPYFKFPEWVTHPRSKKKKQSNSITERSYAQKTDLNKATEVQLQEINGIGKALSKRIVLYREKLGGFTDDIQLNAIWGLDRSVSQKVLNRFTVKTPVRIEKMDINTISASDIATIPGISFDLAKKIWEYRVLHEGISDFSELEKIEGLSPLKLQLIQLYLYL